MNLNQLNSEGGSTPPPPALSPNSPLPPAALEQVLSEYVTMF